MKSISKKSFLKKLIISYVTILILPILVMSFSVYRQFDNVLKNELITNNTNTLERTAYILDSNVSNLYTVKEKIISDTTLTSSRNLSDPEKILAIQSEFSKYLASNFFINEISIYFHGEDYIYTSKSSHKLPFFINNSYVFSDWDEASFIKDISTLKEATIREAETVTLPTGSTSKLITFLYPVSQNNRPIATLMFFVDRAYIENIIQSSTEESISEIIILNNKDNLIVSTYENYQSDKENIKGFLLSDKKTNTITLSNRKYQISYSASNATNLTYIMLTPLNHVLQKERNILISSLIILLLLLCAGIVVIVFSLKVTYNPIKTLKEYSSDIASLDLNSDDEIETIKETISHLATENNNIISRSAPMTQDYILETLIKGRYNSIEELNDQARPFNITFKIHLYAVLIFHVYSGVASKKQIKSIMDNFFFGLIKEEHSTAGRFIAVITPDNNDYDLLSQSLFDFQQTLMDEFGIFTTIGVGNIYDEIQKVPVSYMQACSAIDYRLVRGNGSIIHYSAVSSLIEYEVSYPSKNLENLKYFIKQGNIESIDDILNETLDFIKKDNAPLFVVRSLCFDMINTTWKAFTEIQKTLVLPTINYPNIMLLSKYDTVDDLIQILKNFCANICNEINDLNIKNDESLINSILDFIKENYRDNNFTIQVMADHFDMSLTNISQYFKTRTGQTIIDYITNLRITEAKEKLLNTEMSVNEIALHIGYLNSSSFIRRFKQITGLTPKQFLSENKK